MKTYKVKIQGESKMIQNRLGKDLIDELKKVKKDKYDEWEENNWIRKAYTDPKTGEYILPDLLIYAHLAECAKKHPNKPPKSVGRTWTNYMKSSILIPDNAKLSHVKIDPFGIMVNGNPSSNKKGSKVYKIRPTVDKGWVAEFKIIDIVESLNIEELETMLENGGRFVGLCDWRPLYGRYSVLSVQEVAE